MASSALATAFVNIVPGTQQMEAYLKGDLSGQAGSAGVNAGGEMAKGVGSGMGAKLKGYLKPVVAGFAASFAAVGVTNFLKDTVNQASSFQAEFEGVNQTFGRSQKVIQDYAKSASKLAGMSEVDALRAAKSFGVYGKAAGLGSDANAQFSKTLLQTAGDLGSFYDLPTGEALDAISSGLRGEAEPLRKFGILLDDATLKAAYMAETGKKVTGALTPQQKILAANAAILKQVGVAQGDFVKYGDTYGNAIKTSAAEFDNLKGRIGEGLLPIMATLAQFAITTLIPAFENVRIAIVNFVNWVKQNSDWLGPIVTAVLAGVAAFKIWTGAIAVWQTAVKIATGIQAIFNAVMAANPIMLLVIAIAALVGGLVYFFTQTKTGQKIWAGFTSFLGDTIKNVGAWFASVWQSIVAGWNNVVNWFKNLPGVIVGALKGAGTWLVNTGKNLIQGLLNGAGSLLKNIGNFFLNLLPGWIVAPFKAALGIHSPSKVFIEFGKNIVAGLHDGLVGSKQKTQVETAMKQVSDWVTQAFDDKKISKKQLKAANALTAAYTAQLNRLEAEHTALADKLDAAQKDLADRVQQRANYIQGLVDKFGSSLSIDNDTTAKSAIQWLTERVAKTRELKKVTDQLQAMGLDQSLYKQIVEAGAVDFAKSIIEGGSEAVNQLNVLAKESDAAAVELATKVGDTLYNQGIQFAQAVVNGLTSQEATLTALMNAVASAFQAQIQAIIANAQSVINGAVADAESMAANAASSAANAAKAAASANKATTTANKKATTTKTSTVAKAATAAKAVAARITAGKGIPKFAAGGFVNKPTIGLIGEAGPEVVTPLKDFERMMNKDNNGGPSITYVAAPNNSLDAEQALLQAIRRAKVVGAW